MKVFFDVDGVLIDGWHAQVERRRRWDLDLERDLGIKPEALQRTLFSAPANGEMVFMRCIRGELDLKDLLAESLPRLGYSGSVDAFVDYWFSRDSVVNEDVLDVVRELATVDGLSLFIATNQEHHRAAHLWEKLTFADLFDGMFYSAEFGTTKTDPRFFAGVNAQLGIGSDERPLFFDDTPAVVATARAAGWDAYLFDSADDLRGNARLAEFLRT